MLNWFSEKFTILCAVFIGCRKRQAVAIETNISHDIFPDS